MPFKYGHLLPRCSLFFTAKTRRIDGTRTETMTTMGAVNTKAFRSQHGSPASGNCGGSRVSSDDRLIFASPVGATKTPYKTPVEVMRMLTYGAVMEKE
jgi:hypothetical protein